MYLVNPVTHFDETCYTAFLVFTLT